MQKLLITGSAGQLGKAFVDLCQKENRNFVAFSRQEFDITDDRKVDQILDECRPDAVINCAAMRYVDLAEEKRELAFAVNASAPGHLAESCGWRKILFVHFSSDYVFEGELDQMYHEDDATHPINVYGESKRAGEQAVEAKTENHLIFRTSWVFSRDRRSLLHHLELQAESDDVIRVVADQFSAPSYTADIVRYTLLAVDKGLRGLFHLCNTGRCSRYELAEYYYKARKIEKKVIPISRDEFKWTAKRPQFTAMSNEKLSKALGVKIPDWRDAINRFVGHEEKDMNEKILTVLFSTGCCHGILDFLLMASGSGAQISLGSMI